MVALMQLLDSGVFELEDEEAEVKFPELFIDEMHKWEAAT